MRRVTGPLARRALVVAAALALGFWPGSPGGAGADSGVVTSSLDRLNSALDRGDTAGARREAGNLASYGAGNRGRETIQKRLEHNKTMLGELKDVYKQLYDFRNEIDQGSVRQAFRLIRTIENKLAEDAFKQVVVTGAGSLAAKTLQKIMLETAGGMQEFTSNFDDAGKAIDAAKAMKAKDKLRKYLDEQLASLLPVARELEEERKALGQCEEAFEAGLEAAAAGRPEPKTKPEPPGSPPPGGDAPETGPDAPEPPGGAKTTTGTAPPPPPPPPPSVPPPPPAGGGQQSTGSTGAGGTPVNDAGQKVDPGAYSQGDRVISKDGTEYEKKDGGWEKTGDLYEPSGGRPPAPPATGSGTDVNKDFYDRRNKKSDKDRARVDRTGRTTAGERETSSAGADEVERVKIAGQEMETDKGIDNQGRAADAAADAADAARRTGMGAIASAGLIGGLTSGVAIGLDGFFGTFGQGLGAKASDKWGLTPKPPGHGKGGDDGPGPGGGAGPADSAGAGGGDGAARPVAYSCQVTGTARVVADKGGSASCAFQGSASITLAPGGALSGSSNAGFHVSCGEGGCSCSSRAVGSELTGRHGGGSVSFRNSGGNSLQGGYTATTLSASGGRSGSRMQLVNEETGAASGATVDVTVKFSCRATTPPEAAPPPADPKPKSEGGGRGGGGG